MPGPVMACSRVSRLIGGLIVLLLGSACAGPATQSGASQGGPATTAQTAQPAHPPRVVVPIGRDTDNLATKLAPSGSFEGDIKFMVNSPLVVLDPRGSPHLRLAGELPSQERGTWIVNPDGTMVTTWSIRSGAVWHDGAQVTSNDFVFAFSVYMDPTIPVPIRQPEQLIDRIDPLDAARFSIHWTQPYPWANQLLSGQLDPLPAHLLGPLYEGANKDNFINAPFWSSTAYVGSGPFRLVEWEKGVQMVYRAFDGYYLGRPKLDEVVFKVMPDMNTVVANLFSGAVDATVGLALNQQAGLVVKEEWGRSGEGTLLYSRTHLRNIQIQHDPSRTQQGALLDLRVRRALVHALDREAIGQTLSGGITGSADILLNPDDRLYERADRVIAKYPYDLTRALAMLQESGWTKRGDSVVSPSGQPFGLDLRAVQVSDNEAHMTLIASYLSALGAQVSQGMVSQALNSDLEFRATFPGMHVTGTAIDVPRIMRDYATDQCPRAERRFVGSNLGCWSNPAFDRLHGIVMTTMSDSERDDAIVESFRLLTEDVGVIGMSYVLENLAVRTDLVGIGPRWPAQRGTTWNVHEWHWR